MTSKKVRQVEYAFLSLAVNDFSINSGISINHEVHDSRHSPPETGIYQQYSSITLRCRNIDPADPLTDTYQFSLYGQSTDSMSPELTLADYHVRDDEGFAVYRKKKGEEIPVYDLPKGMGVLAKHRGERHWSSALWLTPAIVSDMIALLLSDKEIYAACHIRYDGRVAWLNGFDLQTINPLEC